VPVTAIDISVEDPVAQDVVSLLERHVAFAREVTPAGGVFALDVEALRAPDITFFCARAEGTLVGVAALHHLDDEHGEIKSMHTAAEARGRGVGRTLVTHLVEVARRRDYRRVSLETGNFDAFEPARRLYASCGFVPCPPYGEYVGSTTSECMTIELRPT